jgi:hypothetical protein
MPTGRRAASADLIAVTSVVLSATRLILELAASASALAGLTPLLLHGRLGLYGQVVARHWPYDCKTLAPTRSQVPHAGD